MTTIRRDTGDYCRLHDNFYNRRFQPRRLAIWLE